MYNNESATYEIINLVAKNPKKEKGALKTNTGTKEKIRISDCGFRELSAICKEMPSMSAVYPTLTLTLTLTAVTKRMNDFNINLNVIGTPRGNGAQVESVEDFLRNNLFM